MKRPVLAMLTIALLAVAAFAQSNTGRLVGTVSGPDGVLPGATVEITDNKTKRTRTETTNGEGGFTVPTLEVGTYTVKITANGFKTFTATDVKIDVGREYALAVTLEVGAVSENVTVVAGADILNATNAELSNTVSQRQIQDLPLNGRNPLNLITLQAGTASNGSTNTTINGQRSSFTNITRDGLNIQDNFIRSNATDFAPERPSVDNTGEFTLTTQNAGASKGYGSSQVELVTPRGQSEFHGTLFEYNRNSYFGANSFFNNRSGIPLPLLNRNQFGGTISGPAPAPRFGEGGPATAKNKLFFFAYYEGLRLRTSTTRTNTILTPTARNGIFTFVNNAGVVQQVNLFSLTSGIPGTGVTRGITGVNPLIQSRILNNIPAVGNSNAVGDQLNTTGYVFAQQANTNRDSFTTRVDYEINSKNSVYGVFTYSDENNLRPDVDAATGTLQPRPAGYNNKPVTVQPATNKFLALTYTFTPSPKFSNLARGGLFLSSPVFNSLANYPNFLVLPLVSSPEVNFQQQGRYTNYYNLQDNAEYLFGNHSLQFGGMAQYFRINPFGPGAFGANTIPAYSLGTNTNTGSLSAAQFASLGGINSAQLSTANALLALLGGVVSSASQTFNALDRTSGFIPGALPSRHLNFENYSLYVQDQWRVSPKLTLNLGLRYEAFTAVREPNGLALEPAYADLNNPIASLLDPNETYQFVGGNLGGNKFFNNDTNNFGPVLSFAYTPEFKNKLLGTVFGKEAGRTVIRGGFRQSFVNDEFVRAADNALGANQGLSLGASAINPATNTTALNTTVNSLPSITAPAFAVPRTAAQNNLLAGLFGTIFGINPNLQAPKTTEYNIGIQRELGFQTALEIRYVGGRSRNLVKGIDLNQVDITSNGFLADFNRARANLLLTGNPACTSAGCQTLTVFPNLASGGLLTNATIQSLLRAGTPADLAITYVTNGLTGSVKFLANPNTGVVDYLTNGASYFYNSLQVEFRRRFAQGFAFQANYTFQKTLTDAQGVGQTRFEPNLSNALPQLEYDRADYDQTHVFNFNTVYELPIGNGKRFLNRGGLSDKIFGGYELTTIIRAGTGAPLTITDPRGTLNRAGRSGRQTPQTNLTKDQIKALIGVFYTPCGPFWINPAVININQQALQAGQCSQLNTNGGTGQGALGFGQPTFSGQVFFNNAPGQTGSLERQFLNGPFIFSMDMSLIKNIKFGERTNLQLRAEGFNILNHTDFFVGQFGSSSDINSTNFGRITGLVLNPRVFQFAARFSF